MVVIVTQLAISLELFSIVLMFMASLTTNEVYVMMALLK